MPRLLVLLVLVIIIIAALFFLSTLPRRHPTHTIEVAVPAAGGNAH
jgi:uncharacterized membrane protein